MPLARYDRHFGGAGGATEAHAAMQKQYGARKGESVFYALIAKKKKAAARPGLRERLSS